jgi:hypothetical protein
MLTFALLVSKYYLFINKSRSPSFHNVLKTKLSVFIEEPQENLIDTSKHLDQQQTLTLQDLSTLKETLKKLSKEDLKLKLKELGGNSKNLRYKSFFFNIYIFCFEFILLSFTQKIRIA